MKQLFRYIILLSFFYLASCEKMFHPEETSIGKIDDYEKLLEAVGGVYGSLSRCFYDLEFYYETSVKGDDFASGEPFYSSYYFDACYDEGIPLAHWAGFNSTWQLLYKTIASANNILSQYSFDTKMGNATKEILGEIYLIRAYCYFRLTRTYGEIPVIDDIEISFSVPKSSYKQIYEFIVNDLNTAVRFLPKKNDEARIPYITPHRGSAKAILAEVYLSWAGYPVNDPSKYDLAAKTAGEVIDSAEYYGFSLLDDFADLWDHAHLYNSESVFSLYYQDPQQAINTRGGDWIYNNSISPYYGVSGLGGNFIITAEAQRISPCYFATEINFYNNYPDGYRKESTFYTTIFKINVEVDEQGNVIKLDSVYMHIDTVDPCARIGYQKFYYDPYFESSTDTLLPFGFFIGIPRIYLFRYSQTLLTYAEATARTGKLNELAYECVNQIRRRANKLDLYAPSEFDLTPGLSAEIFADSVVWERAWEHAGEPEGRWFDLVRLEEVEELEQLRHPQEGGIPRYPITKEDYFMPIPQQDIILNPALEE